MLCILNTSTHPQFNLAAEEYLLKERNEDIFMLWRNEPSIIVGKHQNTLSEIHVDYVKENDIKVVRRLTGGGAVFHDLGNLNFTFIHTLENVENQPSLDFRKYTLPILEVLNGLGVDARFEGRNDLTIEGKKFSGNAECVHRNRILHHGTLLFSAQLPDLGAALNADPSKFSDKAVKSVRSRVTNISEHLKYPMDVVSFKHLIYNHITRMYPDSVSYTFTEGDQERIQQLVREKYDTWEWNFGKSPEYNFRKVVKTTGGHVEFDLWVDKGIIREARIYGDFFSRGDIQDVESALKGCPHTPAAVEEKLKSIDIDLYFNNIKPEELLPALY